MALSYPEAAAEIMEHLCKHSAHGYSQANREGIGTGGIVAETITLSDGTKVGISYGDRDCSSAVIECYAALGVNVGGATYTGNMRNCMVGTGNFRWEPMGNGYIAKRGDIYLNESHHAAMCLDDNPDTLGQFSISETGGVTGQRGDQTGYESNIKAYYNYPWNGKLVYCGPARAGSNSNQVAQPPMQSTSGKIEVDGFWGNATTLKAQQILGTPADGIISSQDACNKKYCPGCTFGWEWLNGGAVGSQLIIALQKKWGAKPDGFFGPKTINAMIAYCQKRGSGAKVQDGKLDENSPTIKQFQRELNAGRI